MWRTVVVLCLWMSPAAFAQHPATGEPARPAPVLPGLGSLRHPVSTTNAEAQRFFDQGLRLAYAFNHDEAFRAFARAGQLDPQLAMARWGQALVLGPNINLPTDEERSRRAWALIEEARRLGRDAPEVERAYIEALAQRYAAEPPADRSGLDRAYASAMRELARRYPDDLDAAVLFAEAMMNLRPWAYWKDGRPAEGTEEIVATLQSVLRQNPRHTGANHLMIHAVEASPHPELALGAARQLEAEAPAAGHLVHMPTHIYAQLGDHDASARMNEAAAEVDRAYIERHGVTGVYPMLYYNHNLHFAAYSHAQRGDSRNALRMAGRLWQSAEPVAREMQMAELFTITPLLVQARFRRWDDVLQSAAPAAPLVVTRGVWHFARGLAHAGRADSGPAEAERVALAGTIDSLPAGAVVGFSPGRMVLGVAEGLLAGRIAEARGDGAAAIAHYVRAAALEDSLAYDEPPDWYLHVRETLGGAHLRARRAVEAEREFRADLERHPRNGRSLFGLLEALRAQKRDTEAVLVEQAFREAWKGADVRLTVADL